VVLEQINAPNIRGQHIDALVPRGLHNLRRPRVMLDGRVFYPEPIEGPSSGSMGPGEDAPDTSGRL
jgi:hypothetical protein